MVSEELKAARAARRNAERARQRLNDPDYYTKKRAWDKKSKENRKDKIAAYLKEWSKRNSEIVHSYGRKRRAHKYGVASEFYTADILIEVYGSSCHICNEPIDLNAPRKVGVEGWQKGLHIDHIIPLSKGGLDTINNVRPAHGECNIRKHNKIKGKDE